MNITKFEEKVVEIIENSNLFKDYKKCSRYYYYLHVDETRKTMQFILDCETSFNFNVAAKTYNELFGVTLKILKSYTTGVSKTKEETLEEGKGE